MKKIIVECPTGNIDEFRRLAEFAKKNNITHLAVSDIEKSMWQWNRNRFDPYPNWGMKNATLFKIALPEALKKYIPSDSSDRNLEMFSKRAEVLKEYGLKAVFRGMEPSWLPQNVYDDHPAWKGPRCDQTRRARAEYYAPCTDNPEVRALYDESVQKLCSVIPIEYFIFLTNDSGGGFCWSDRLYPGANGPSSCRHIPVAQKVVNFLSLIQESALKVGVNAEVGFDRNFSPSEKSGIVYCLKDGQFCYGQYNKTSFKTLNVGCVAYKNPTYPIRGMSMLPRYAEQMSKIDYNDENNIYYTIDDIDQKEYFKLIEDNAGKTENSMLGKFMALTKTAESFVGKKYASKLVDMWEYTQKAFDIMEPWDVGGNVSMLGTVHQRWLTRPLVAFPSELTEEEKAYYRPYLFQAGTEKEAENPVNMQGTIWLGGESARFNFRNFSQKAIYHIKSAIDIADELLSADDLGDYKEDLKEQKLRLKLFGYIMRNQKNVITFQSIMDRTNFDEPPVDTTLAIDEQGDKRYYKVMNIIREEVDNTYEIIKILDEAKTNILNCTDTEENEDIMNFGPDLKNDLLKKIHIMEKHKLDFERVYKSYNV